MQQSCKLGSVRGEVPPRHGDPKLGTKPETADTDKESLPRRVPSSTRRKFDMDDLVGHVFRKKHVN